MIQAFELMGRLLIPAVPGFGSPHTPCSCWWRLYEFFRTCRSIRVYAILRRLTAGAKGRQRKPNSSGQHWNRRNTLFSTTYTWKYLICSGSLFGLVLKHKVLTCPTERWPDVSGFPRPFAFWLGLSDASQLWFLPYHPLSKVWSRQGSRCKVHDRQDTGHSPQLVIGSSKSDISGKQTS